VQLLFEVPLKAAHRVTGIWTRLVCRSGDSGCEYAKTGQRCDDDNTADRDVEPAHEDLREIWLTMLPMQPGDVAVLKS
jgi:hypothetical protein